LKILPNICNIVVHNTFKTISGERNIRKKMAEEKVEKLPILPNGMNTKSPTWNNIRYFFRNVHLGLVENLGQTIQTFLKGITRIHEIVLKLTGVPLSAYTTIKDNWWIFKNTPPLFSSNST